MYKILLATDGSEHSVRAAKEILKIAKPMQAEITALSVIQATPVYVGYDVPASPWIAMEYLEGLEKSAQKILEEKKQFFAENGLSINTMLEKGQAADVICQIAKEKSFDLIAMGSRGLGGLQQLFLGSVSSSVIQCSEVPVLIVK